MHDPADEQPTDAELVNARRLAITILLLLHVSAVVIGAGIGWQIVKLFSH